MRANRTVADLFTMPTGSGSDPPILWPAIVFGIPAMVMLIIGVALSGNTISFVSTSTVTTGTVIENEKRIDCATRADDDSAGCQTLFHPMVIFTTTAGEEIRFTSDIGSGTALYTVGDRVPVRYLADQPRDAEIDGFQLWLGPVIATGIGIIFGLIATGTLVSYFRKTRAASTI